MTPHRVTFLMTHPVQYLSPWFRWIHAHEPRVQLTVLYATRPGAAAQADGFGGAFTWDTDLLAGYPHRVLGGDGEVSVTGERFSRVDAPNLETALIESAPDAVVIPGWHAAFYRRGTEICTRRRIPTIYRGDTHLASGPRGLKRLAWRYMTRQRLSTYAAWLAVGTRSREYLRAFDVPEPMIFASPHCVEAALFEPSCSAAAARTRFGLAEDRFTVLFAGKLIGQKRPLDAIAAASRIPDAQLLIVGSGALGEACRDEAARRGVRAVFAGFLNQREMADAYAACDCLVLPSESETWGLVVNEAMAAGRPAIVTSAVGCQPDLVHEGVTGAVAPTGDVAGLADALVRVRDAQRQSTGLADACRRMAGRHSFAAATEGLTCATARLRARRQHHRGNASQPTQVLALCGHMVIPGGLERMTFEVLSALRDAGAGVHAVVNRWGSSQVVALADDAGVDWDVYRCDEPLVRRPSPGGLVRMLADIVRGSIDVTRQAAVRRATHVMVPEFALALRHWPALNLLRLTGRRVVLRVGTMSPRTRFYRALWRWGVNTAVDEVVCNSRFFAAEVVAQGVPADKVSVIHNRLSARPPRDSGPRDVNRVIYVGQMIPEKGVDLLLEAIALLRAAGVPVTLDLVGAMDGWESPSYRGYRARLIERINRDDLKDVVRVLGHREDVTALMAETAVHCLPSRPEMREGMASVVLEAKSAATPSVVSRHGSLPELVRHGVDGWIADDTPTALAEGLRHFLVSRERRDEAGEAALSSLQRFSSEQFAAQWRKTFGLQDIVVSHAQAIAQEPLSR